MRETAATRKGSAGTDRDAPTDGPASEDQGLDRDEAGSDGVADGVATATDAATGDTGDDSAVTDSTDGVATDAAPSADSTDLAAGQSRADAAVDAAPTATDDTETDQALFQESTDGGTAVSDEPDVTANLDPVDGFRMPSWARPQSSYESEPTDLDGRAETRSPFRPPYTRPPGMVPPPGADDEVGISGPRSLSAAMNSPSGAYAALSAMPVSAPPRVTGRGPAGLTMPIGLDGSARESSTTGTTRFDQPMRPRPAATPRGPRRARLNVKRVDPWSVMKFSFAVSLVLFIVVIVAASVLYLALDAMGVFTSINSTVAELIQSGSAEGGQAVQITAKGVIGSAAVLGGLNVLLFTSLATLGAFIYNVCADLVGGVEVTLAERD